MNPSQDCSSTMNDHALLISSAVLSCPAEEEKVLTSTRRHQNECRDDNDNNGNQRVRDRGGYHPFYLHSGGLEYRRPIVFQGGMDYEECQLYYSSLESQNNYSGRRRSSRSSIMLDERQPCVRHPTKPTSCLKPSKWSRSSAAESASTDDDSAATTTTKTTSTSVTSARQQMRRLTLSHVPALVEKPPSRFRSLRSTSSRSFDEYQPRVAFEEAVHIITIYHARDYPYEVRSGLWLSSRELFLCVRGAAVEQRKQQAKEEKKKQQQQQQELQQQLQQQQDSSCGKVTGPPPKPVKLKLAFKDLNTKLANGGASNIVAVH